MRAAQARAARMGAGTRPARPDGMQPDPIPHPAFVGLDGHRAAQDDRSRDDRVLVVHGRLGDARPAAEALGHALARVGLEVELATADLRTAPPPDTTMRS